MRIDFPDSHRSGWAQVKLELKPQQRELLELNLLQVVAAAAGKIPAKLLIRFGRVKTF